jgi:hypothetical protein
MAKGADTCFPCGSGSQPRGRSRRRFGRRAGALVETTAPRRNQQSPPDGSTRGSLPPRTTCERSRLGRPDSRSARAVRKPMSRPPARDGARTEQCSSRADRDGRCRTRGGATAWLLLAKRIAASERSLDHAGRGEEESLPRKNVPAPAAPSATTSTPRRRKPWRSVCTGVWNGVFRPRLLTTTT